jgi:soluble lytic murein transglycosylase-like protein
VSKLKSLALALTVVATSGFDATAASVPSACFRQAGERHRIDPLLLHAIAQVESGHKSRAVHTNRDGSKDYGIMQINEINLTADQRKRVVSDPCFGVNKGAEILASMITRYGYNWTAVGGYNAGVSNTRSGARIRYAKKVWSTYQILIRRREGDHRKSRQP